MRPQNIVKSGTITVSVEQNLMRTHGLEEFETVPMDEVWVVKDLAVSISANAGSWILRAQGNELGRGMAHIAATPGELDLTRVPDLNCVLGPGTRFAVMYTAGATTTTAAVHLSIRRYKIGEAF
jgi:hypothetical protein